MKENMFKQFEFSEELKEKLVLLLTSPRQVCQL